MAELHGKNILLGVTGGIAAYKSPDLVRRLKDQGADVRVVMTESAQRMVSATVFQAVSGQPVRGELWDPEAEAAMGHIELAKWADLILIAPATANCLAQLAGGSADHLLTTLCLASEAPIAVAPAMNQAMWSNAATQQNVATLRERGVQIIGPESGDQACGDTGPGRMTEPNDIVAALAAATVGEALAGLSVVISAGPTREPIDPVRFITNRSSGKMGFAVAAAAVAAGAQVTLVSGPVSLATPAGVRRVDVETAEDMHAAVLEAVAGSDIYIGSAAISDYRPVAVSEQKIKKHSEEFVLELTRSRDVLAAVAALDDGPFTVGFAAETEKLEEHARGKLERKKLDMIIANLVGSELCFDRDDNAALILWADGQQELPRKSKQELAYELVSLIAERYRLSESQ